MNFFGSPAATLGGVTIGLSILTYVIVAWRSRHKGTKGAWKNLMPFALFVAYGMLAILTAGGLLGNVAGAALWGTNNLGKLALVYGVGGTDPTVTRSHDLLLTPGGHAVVVILTVGIIASFRFSKMPKLDAGLGIACGISLGLASSVAGVAAMVLGPVVSTGGDWVVGLL